VLITFLLVTTHFTFANITTVAIVKLYSEGRLVSQWKSVDKGYNDGACFVFHVKKGVRTPEVKVCGGVYTVESVH
jgi:hypothetical protein